VQRVYEPEKVGLMIAGLEVRHVHLHVLPRRAVPVVALRMALTGGLLAEDEGNAGIGSFTSAMWTRGTAKRVFELAGQLCRRRGR